MPIDWQFIAVYLARGAWVWLLSRAAASFALLLARADPLRMTAAAPAVFVLMSVAVCFAHTFRRREQSLLGNLAVSPLMLGLLFALPAIAGELLFGVITSAIV
jgi:hypothetical protein